MRALAAAAPASASWPSSSSPGWCCASRRRRPNGSSASWPAGDGLDVIERTRRAQTLGRLIHNLIAVFVSSIALLMVLRELGVDIVPMLTGAGIVGVALGFGSQYLVRDVIAGFFLILENQVRVGDAAVVNGVAGIVEAVNLRTVVLRDGEGTVHVFQNGAINALANRSKDFAYYVIDVNVLYEQNVDRVVEVLKAVGREFAEDARFRPHVLEPLEVLGVDAFLDSKVTIKTRIKTVPLKQWDVGRELRRRIMVALERPDIALQPTAVPLYVADGAALQTLKGAPDSERRATSDPATRPAPHAGRRRLRGVRRSLRRSACPASASGAATRGTGRRGPRRRFVRLTLCGMLRRVLAADPLHGASGGPT